MLHQILREVRFQIRGALAFCFVLLALCCSCFAQNLTGTINGVIEDTSGAVIPGAKVTIANAETGVAERSLTADSGGRYEAAALLSGTYKITVQSPGFQTEVTQVVLNVDQSVQVNMALKVGSVTSQISVSTSVIGPQLEDSAQSTLIEQKEVTELPLNQRNFRAIHFSSAGREWRYGNDHPRTVGCCGRKQPHEHFGKRPGKYFQRLLS